MRGEREATEHGPEWQPRDGLLLSPNSLPPKHWGARGPGVAPTGRTQMYKRPCMRPEVRPGPALCLPQKPHPVPACLHVHIITRAGRGGWFQVNHPEATAQLGGLSAVDTRACTPSRSPPLSHSSVECSATWPPGSSPGGRDLSTCCRLTWGPGRGMGTRQARAHAGLLGAAAHPEGWGPHPQNP